MSYSLLLNHYLKDYKAQSNSSIKKYFIGMQNDVLQICINCIKKLNHISTIFGLKVELESDPKKLKPILERRMENKENREKRQLTTLAVVSAISIVSYYTVSQLTNMAGSDNNDVINNQNHVVEGL